MPRMPKRCERFGALSVLTLTSLILPGMSLAICSTTGETTRQGPHQGAQKSTSTGSVLCSTTAGKSGSLASASQGSAAPHEPQCGTPLAAGRTRFVLPQFEHRISGASSAIASRSHCTGHAHCPKLIDGYGRYKDGRDSFIGDEQILPMH